MPSPAREGIVSSYFEDNKPQGDHVAKSLRGGAVSIVARGINALIQIGSVLFLARLLSPEDYGLVSMVTAFTGFAPVLVDLGTRDAILQRTHITRGEVSALFWITMAVGCAFALIVAGSGPLIARFYHEPRLAMIAAASSLTFVACALTAQHAALVRRALMFQELAAIEVVASVLSAATAIAFAFLGYGYWALVVRPVATPLFMSVGLWSKCRWIPTKPTITTGVKDSLKLGLNVTMFCLTDFAGRSGDRIAIGYRSGPTGLGHYQNALFVYDNLLDVLVFPLHGVAVAGLSKLRHDLPELRKAWGKALSTVAFYAMPIFGVLAVTSQDVIVLLLGAKWASAGLILSVLAFRGMPQSIERTLGWLHVTAGRTDRWVRWGVFATCVQFIALFCGLPFGPIGVAVAYVVSMFVLFVPAIAYAGQPLGIGSVDVIRIVWRQMLASFVSAGLAFWLRWNLLAEMAPVVRVFLLLLVYVLTYLVLAVGVLNVRAPLRTVRSLCRGYLPARFANVTLGS
jgi:polysaccharide transporter, PST family